ncbi:MAG: hypothetical protein JST61_04095 [Acidobacteria bacterium]|nr:hypothetical protein [Acidobacteriota bacterium]
MLPLLKLDFSTLCQSGLDLRRIDTFSGRSMSDAEVEATCRAYTGEAFAFQAEDLLVECQSSRMNLDKLLSRSLVAGFTRHPIKRKCMLWFGWRFQSIIITICDSRGQLDPAWMYDLPGYFESGNDFVGNTDRPYGYWDGNNFHRIYPDRQRSNPSKILVADFGNAFGWSVGEANSYDPKEVSKVLEANSDPWLYSIVPESHEEIIKLNNSRCLLLHSRYR